MNSLTLITRPFYDITTCYLYHWNNLIIDFAEEKGIKIIDLNDKRANRKELTSILTGRNPHLILLNGHGSADFITGHDNQILIKTKDNEIILKDKIVYALSCQTGKTLGPSCVKIGTKAYIGYKEDFIFIISDDKLTKPIEDGLAKMFLEPSIMLVISLLKGHTVQEAHEKFKNIYLKTIQESLASNSNSTYLVRFLIWNYTHQVCLGNPDSKL